MAGKRQAAYELNHDNYADELPPEEAGQWKPADETVLKNRPKLKARRSLANSSSDSEKPSLFGSFSFNLNGSGSGAALAPPPASSPFASFNFGSNNSSSNSNSNSNNGIPTNTPSSGATSNPAVPTASVAPYTPFANFSFTTPKEDSKKDSPVTIKDPTEAKETNTSVWSQAKNSAGTPPPSVTNSNNKETRLKEISQERIRLLKEKQLIEAQLKKLELEEGALVKKGKSSTGDEASTEEPDLPPEEPWN